MPSTERGSLAERKQLAECARRFYRKLNYPSIFPSIQQILRRKENSIEIFALDTFAEMEMPLFSANRRKFDKCVLIISLVNSDLKRTDGRPFLKSSLIYDTFAGMENRQIRRSLCAAHGASRIRRFHYPAKLNFARIVLLCRLAAPLFPFWSTIREYNAVVLSRMYGSFIAT